MGNYVDDGATCSDQVDGVISQNVEVSGDVVNLSKVGTYVITYNCKDSAGNSAPTTQRTVHVRQTSCPTCEITGQEDPHVQKHEAGFEYTDQGAVCTDPIDGDITPYVTDGGDKLLDCDDETGATCAVNNLAEYIVTYTVQNSVGLWNYGTCRDQGHEYYRTVVVEDTLKPVIQLKYNDVAVAQGLADDLGHKENSVADGENDPNLTVDGEVHEDYTRPNPAISDGVSAGLFDPMMAEKTRSGMNGWVIGAIASAVTGLALLGMSQRKHAVTSVPV